VFWANWPGSYKKSTWFHKLEFADYSPAELFEENWRKEHECFSWVD
jgi:hypothetical protein